jgi:nudix-type nucleoside diphosphatase (YffH/AdpP family)
MSKVKNISSKTLSNNWATLDRIDFDYQFPDGSWKRLSRESYNRGNGACVFLYNRDTGNVILTKQFRMPAYANDNNDGMSVELCAGAIDKNEDPKVCIIREVEEEVGLRINNAELVMENYMSPGAVTEKMYYFIGEYKDSDKITSGGGLEVEDEDIEVLELPFLQVLKMMNSGEIKDAKTVILLQYAQLRSLL